MGLYEVGNQSLSEVEMSLKPNSEFGKEITHFTETLKGHGDGKQISVSAFVLSHIFYY